MELKTGLALYAAVLSTVIALVQLYQWWKSHIGIELSILPRIDEKGKGLPVSIEVDIQAVLNKTEIQSVYIAAFSNWCSAFSKRKPAKVLSSGWGGVFPVTIEPGQGWEGLLAINEKERSLANEYPHVFVMVRHSGRGRLVGKRVSKMLRRN